MELREAHKTSDLIKLERLGFWHADKDEAERLINVLNAVEIGRIVTRDIGGSDPERMAAGNVLNFVRKVLDSTNIKVENKTNKKFESLQQ